MKTYENKRERFSAFVFPYLGKRPIQGILVAVAISVLALAYQANHPRFTS